MLAAHLSWWKITLALETKLDENSSPIFSGEHKRQKEKLDQLLILNTTPSLKRDKKKSEATSPSKALKSSVSKSDTAGSDNKDKLLDPNLNLIHLKDFGTSKNHLLAQYSKIFSPNNRFDEQTVESIIHHKQLSSSGPAAKALRRIQKILHDNPELINENYTHLFLQYYDQFAFDPKTYDSPYEMREALTKMNYKPSEIDEFEHSLNQEETYNY